MRRVAIKGGGDWNDASVDHIQIPDTLDLEEAKKDWRWWYETVYLAKMHTEERVTYMGLYQWLLEHGATDDDDIEEFWDD